MQYFHRIMCPKLSQYVTSKFGQGAAGPLHGANSVTAKLVVLAPGCWVAAWLPEHLHLFRYLQRKTTEAALLSSSQRAAPRLGLKKKPQRKLFKVGVCCTGLAQSLRRALITPEPKLAQRE